MSKPYKKAGNPRWYGYRILASGKRITRSLDTQDYREAVRRLREFEAEADPTAGPSANAPAHSVEDALRFIVEVGCQDASPSTWDMYAKKAGHVARLLGNTGVNDLHIDDVQRYIRQRLDEGAARETVRKELSTLRKALEEAKGRGLFLRDPRSVVPKFRVTYNPRRRFLSVAEFSSLLAALQPHRSRWVAVAVYSGARRSEVESLRWENHIDLESGWVFIPGTKTAGSHRKVPLPGPLAEYLRSTPLKAGPLVEPWGNVGRDLPAACARAGIARATPNDLRRTYASWMKQAGEDSAVVAKLLGHSSTRMVDLVYGRLADENLVSATSTLPAVTLPGLSSGSRTVADSGAPLTQERSRERKPPSAGPSASPPKNNETPRTLQSAGPLMSDEMSVPGPGIEPGTRGFSVPCSTS